MKLGSGYHMINSNNSEGGDDRDWEWVTLLQEYLQQFPSYIQIVGWLIVLFVLIFAVFLLFSLLLGPFMWLFNRLTDKNRSNVLGHEDF